MNNSLTDLNEGSISEYNSFTNMLLADIRRNPIENHGAAERRQTEIYDILLETKKKLEEIRPLDETNNLNLNLLNIDQVDNFELLQSCLNRRILPSISLDSLNLIQEKIDIIGNHYIYQNSDKYCVPKSYLLIPTQTINFEVSGGLFPLDLKQEIIFSKISEKFLIEILDKFKDATQSYYISIRSFARICNKDTKNPISYYKGKFSYKHSFADRTYFDSTIEKGFRVSHPYIDTAGFGIIRTYTISIENRNLGILGIIGIDMKIESLKSALEKMNFGAFFRNFSIQFCKGLQKEENNSDGYFRLVDIDGNKLTNIRREEEIQITNFFNNNKDEFQTSVCRYSSSIRRAIIYSVPIGKEEIALFIFDRDKLKNNNIYLALLFLTVLFVSMFAIAFISNLNIQKIKSEKKQIEIFSELHSSFVISDKDWFILDYNDEFIEMTKQKNVRGKDLREFLTNDSVKDIEFLMQCLKEKIVFPVDIVLPDESTIPCMIINTVTKYPMAKSPRISVFIESENLESAIELKYVDKISHMLKSPLHSILLLADQLRRKTAKPRYDQYFNILNTEIKDFDSEITKLLGIARVESKHLEPEFEKFKLSKLVNNIYNQYEIIARKMKLSLNKSIADNVWINADRVMIKVAIENILDNAYKYTLEGGVTLALYHNNQNAKVLIKDTGIGIPEEELDLVILKKFRGKHPLIQKSEGKGLGLFQSSNYIMLHDGKMNIKSIVAEGTELEIIIPKRIEII